MGKDDGGSTIEPSSIASGLSLSLFRLVYEGRKAFSYRVDFHRGPQCFFASPMSWVKASNAGNAMFVKLQEEPLVANALTGISHPHVTGYRDDSDINLYKKRQYSIIAAFPTNASQLIMRIPFLEGRCQLVVLRRLSLTSIGSVTGSFLVIVSPRNFPITLCPI